MKGVWPTIIFFARLRLTSMQPLFNVKYITLDIFWNTKVEIYRRIYLILKSYFNSLVFLFENQMHLIQVDIIAWSCIDFKKSWNVYCVKKCIITRLLMGKFVCACSKLYFPFDPLAVTISFIQSNDCLTYDCTMYLHFMQNKHFGMRSSR